MKSYNIKFPSEDDNTTNSFYKTNNISNDGLISNLYLLLLTRKGERYYMPDFGTNLLKFIFEPNDDINNNDIEASIKEDVSKYLPELLITTIQFNNDEQHRDEYKLSVEIGFRFNDTGENGTIGIDF